MLQSNFDDRGKTIWFTSKMRGSHLLSIAVLILVNKTPSGSTSTSKGLNRHLKWP